MVDFSHATSTKNILKKVRNKKVDNFLSVQKETRFLILNNIVSFLIVVASVVYTILGSNSTPWVYIVFAFIVRTLEVLYACCALFLTRKPKPVGEEDRVSNVSILSSEPYNKSIENY